MSGFAIRYPFFIIMLCLIIMVVVGITTMARMPVDLFPDINIPVVVVATFYSGMPPEQIEANITNPFERFFTLGSGIDHIESRSLTGVSLIKIYFQPGDQPGRGRQRHFQSGDGAIAALASRHVAAGGA
jgi:hydrophobic/amphiphilic exporter-1 (mainly G- bacteria), HAE1 family